jgi:preprotein translocase subunit SecD
MVCFGVVALWAALTALNIVDANWRMRSGLVASICIVAAISFWPSVDAMSGGRIPCPEFIKERIDSRLVAGLDLRGGLRLVYTVDVDEAIRDRRDRLLEDMQAELARLLGFHEGTETRPSEEAYQQLREKVELVPAKTSAEELTLIVKDAASADKIDSRFLTKFSSEFSFAQSADKLRYDFQLREEVSSELRETAVRQAKDIILRRVDELGLREAAVSTRDEDIIVEVPGEEESSFKEIRDIISRTARLEFKLNDDTTDFFGPMAQNPPEGVPDGVSFVPETVSVGEENGKVKSATTTYAQLDLKEGEAAKDGLERFRAWVNTLDVPPDREIGFEVVRRVVDDATLEEKEVGWRTYLLRRRAEITGDLISDAQAVPDSEGVGGWYVNIRFTDAGGNIFGRITGENIKRRFAIILDNKVESTPVIQDRIAGGSARITLGSNDPQKQLADARQLELVLRSGALPAPITPSNEQHIGPSLGASSIDLGVRGALAGALLVLVVMLFIYQQAGIIANIAVGVNLFLLLAILASFGASMTLPGIAGLALNLGMAVDANVLINERIREELRGGKSPRAAVELGYGRALSAIVDGHLTTFISAVVLFQFGTGPIKGFALTLIVGVATSIFCGVLVSRVMFDLWVRGMDRNAKLSMG